MRMYGKIESGFWHNPKVRPLSEASKFLLLYIYTCPHGNSVGCFILPDGYISADLGWPPERVGQHVAELVSKGFIERDQTTDLTRIIGWFGHNTIENENVAKAAIKTISSLPQCVVKCGLIKELNALGNRFLDKFVNTFPNPEPSQSPTQPEPEPEPEPSSAEGEHPPAFQLIYEAGCAALPGLVTANTSPIRQWLTAGCSPELDAIPEINRLAVAGKNIRSWSYFTSAIMDAKATRERPLPPGTPRRGYQPPKPKITAQTL